ncbi:MAG: hypothetical protein NZ898_10245 [Myxococcota bacterium]|nr:hypothetical protein [Myxococcota bacterium]MDW8362639.1 hypothetical protein [Myxococcales bacterium]
MIPAGKVPHRPAAGQERCGAAKESDSGATCPFDGSRAYGVLMSTTSQPPRAALDALRQRQQALGRYL